MIPPIALVLADVDGTLVTREKLLTEAAVAAVADLRKAGIRFAITSGRPPQGMAMLSRPLDIDTPIAGFNGGVMVAPDLQTIIHASDLPPAIVGRTMRLLRAHGLDVWVYTRTSWLVADQSAPHVDREAWTVKFAPEIAPDLFDRDFGPVVKIVGVTDDLAKMKTCEAAARQEFGDHVTAACSQPYYLDVTSTAANKGAVVDRLSRLLKIDRSRIATIGDMPNDVTMFERSGVSIAMGNAGEDVKRQATYVTDTSERDGFAKAMRRFILDRVPA